MRMQPLNEDERRIRLAELREAARTLEAHLNGKLGAPAPTDDARQAVVNSLGHLTDMILQLETKGTVAVEEEDEVTPVS
ncbi:MAG: hypothetical protein HYV42_04750 [Candidatus Magasanikbacteria bacterium]|nr:hypothetical protein [Candidatus Magasanikbacteria bacterium]